MAGDWIPMRTDLAEDPAVIGIADATGLDECGVVGRLHRLWSWASWHTEDGDIKGVTLSWVNRHVQSDGFAEAMEKVGWLITTKNGIRFPKFEEWNSQSAKKRRLTAKRVALHRENNCNASGVTNSFIDRYTHCVGFADALRKVGWLSGRDAAIEFPNFNRHNGQTAKTRALTKGRVDKARGNCNGASVTKALPETETDKKFSGTERNGTNRSVETIGMQGFGTHLASKLPPRDSGDLRFLMLVGRAVDERHIAEALVHPALIGCDAKGVRKPIGMFRAALEKNIAAAGGDLDTIIKTLQGGSDGSGE